MVWIESITTRRGTAPSDSVETISSTDVSAASCTGASARPSRSARSRTCATASSPEIYTARWPARASRLVACVSNVDLPMPGSPPTRSTEPRTNPPPVTRSNSAIPDGRRGASWLLPVSVSSANCRPLRRERTDTGIVVAPMSSSASVFHSPQDSHLPCQRLYAAPQFWQTKERVDLAIGAGEPVCECSYFVLYLIPDHPAIEKSSSAGVAPNIRRECRP